MEEERISRRFGERLERSQAEITARLAKIDAHWRAGEEARRHEWEELEGRLMTAEERRQHFDDGLFRKMAVMTEEYIKIMREGGETLQQEIAEQRAQIRANTEAVLKALDRLPPGSD
jgi:hypothetical protein